MASLQKTYSKEKLTGQIFTPYFIVNKILDDTGYNSPKILGKKILDPACGDGRFLVKIVERIIKYSPPKNLVKNLEKVYGWDIDAEALEIAKKNLDVLVKPLHISMNWNLEVVDSLQKTSTEKFDYIVGNPPYIRIQHLAEEKRKFLQKHYAFCRSGSTDIYIAFYELALRLLKEDGTAGYITPNSFFHTETARELRRYFERHQNLLQITHYGHLQLFENATTYSAIVIFDKQKHKDFLFQQAETKTQFQARRIPYKEIQGQKFWQLSVKKPRKVSGKRLVDIAKIHVGITTLADKIYIMPFVKEEGKYLHLHSKHFGIVKIEKGILKPIIKVSTLKHGKEPIREYVLFPYKKIAGKHRIFPEEELQTKFPLAYEYLLKVKPILDRRDNGKPNPVAWYAFGRMQGLNTTFGKKILFAPMNKEPDFILSEIEEATFYSGYCIKYEGDYNELLEQLNSERMKEYIQVAARDFRGGWKAYNKKIIQEFIIEIKN